MSSTERLYLQHEGTWQKWLKITNAYREKNELPPFLEKKDLTLQFSTKHALKKCGVLFADWQVVLKKFRLGDGGEDKFLEICKNVKLHEQATNAAKIAIVKAVMGAAKKKKKKTKKKKTTNKVPRKRPQYSGMQIPNVATPKIQGLIKQNLTHGQRNYQKVILRPYLETLYQLNILDPTVHKRSLLLSAEVLDFTARRQWCYYPASPPVGVG